MKFPPFIENALKVLRAKPTIGGLEISDTAVRFAMFRGNRWQLFIERLAPGTLQGGEVKNYAEFVKSLTALRGQIGSGRADQKVNAIVSVSSLHVYSQAFSLPLIEGENLERAVDLNLQVVSPTGFSENYSGWQIIGKDANGRRMEILSSFAKRDSLDRVKQALRDAGFLPVVVEFKALALTRLLREAGSGFDKLKSYLVLYLDSSGLDIIIVRHGEMYFEYFNSWRDIQGDERELTNDVFRAALIRNFHQVLNFSSQHWPEQVVEVLLSAGNLTAEVLKIINEAFSFNVRELTFKSSESTSFDWFVVLGSGLRSLTPRQKDKEVNLLGAEAEEEFHRTHLLRFVGFWRVLVPVALSVLLATFVAVNVFLSRTSQTLKANAALQLSLDEANIIEELEGKVQRFNQTISLIRGIRGGLREKTPVLEKIMAIVKENNITLNRLQFKEGTAPVLLAGEAFTEQQIIAFKQAIEKDGRFRNVDLPLSGIRTTPDQKSSFSLNFLVSSETTE